MSTTSQDDSHELQAALARLIEGESEPEDDQRIAEAMRGDVALVDALREQLMLDEMLRQEAEPSAEVFVAAVAARLQPSASDEAFVARMEQALPRSRKPQKWQWRAPLAWAAGLVMAALIGALMFVSLTPASAASVVQRALKVHAALLDRCYRVELRGERDGAAPPRQESLLWTRGDRFWNQVQGGGKSVSWGRDEAGGVWFALSPKEGARLAADEVPEALALACELRSLEFESLLRTILADFDLRREPSGSGRDVIHAELKPGRVSKYRSALLEADAQSGVLRRVELHREHEGRVVATINATLVESGLQADASYTLEGHLDTDGMIYDRTSGRGQRGPVIAEFLRLIRVR
jgi:hypothetical protein